MNDEARYLQMNKLARKYAIMINKETSKFYDKYEKEINEVDPTKGISFIMLTLALYVRTRIISSSLCIDKSEEEIMENFFESVRNMQKTHEIKV